MCFIMSVKELQERYDKSVKKYPEFADYVPHDRKTWVKRIGEINGVTVKIVMVSRFGDVGITTDLDKETCYEKSVSLYQINNLRKEYICHLCGKHAYQYEPKPNEVDIDAENSHHWWCNTCYQEKLSEL